jgi:hypothetical protein
MPTIYDLKPRFQALLRPVVSHLASRGREFSAVVVSLVADLWGLAEATLFFIVPDVWLSLAGRRRLQTGLRACLFALAGALLGGALVYIGGAHDKQATITLLEKIPAISPAMVARVAMELADHGTGAIFIGPLTGTPYKLCAAQAVDAGIGLAVYILMSMPARGIRFVLVTLPSITVLKLHRP